MHKILTGSLQVDRFVLAIADLPPDLQGTKIVQMTDFHYDGVRLSDELLHEAIAASNAAQPDLVCLTGDFVTDDPYPIYQLAQHLQQLQSRYGVYAILGNHDIYLRPSRPQITQALEDVGIQVLWNQVVYPLGEGLAIAGLAEYWSSDFKAGLQLIDQLPADRSRLVLAHNPDCAASLQAYRVDLQLSGHTHGGQIIIPGIGNISELAALAYRWLPKNIRRKIPVLASCHRVMRHWKWAKGFYQIGANALYVNRGLGTYLPGRLFCPPEVTVITLLRK
jgi:uncharacterized protein